MKKVIKIILCIMGTFTALIVVLWLCFSYVTNYKKITCDTSISPDGKYELTLQAIGEPDWPFGSASGRLILKEDKNKISQTDFELWNDGGMISSRCWKVTWYENYVEVILSGEEQFDEQVLLYFDGKQEIQQLIDREDDSASEEMHIDVNAILDENRVIQEQSFDIELDKWGKVRFVSYLPSNDIYMEDVSFLLTKDNQILYTLPTYCENNTIENYVGLFDSLVAVGFQDVNNDNLQDVIAIINYVTGAGPQGMLPRPTIRIYLSNDNGFVLAEDLMDEIMANMDEVDMSIAAICKHIKENKVN